MPFSANMKLFLSSFYSHPLTGLQSLVNFIPIVNEITIIKPYEYVVIRLLTATSLVIYPAVWSFHTVQTNGRTFGACLCVHRRSWKMYQPTQLWIEALWTGGRVCRRGVFFISACNNNFYESAIFDLNSKAVILEKTNNWDCMEIPVWISS